MIGALTAAYFVGDGLAEGEAAGDADGDGSGDGDEDGVLVGCAGPWTGPLKKLGTGFS